MIILHFALDFVVMFVLFLIMNSFRQHIIVAVVLVGSVIVCVAVDDICTEGCALKCLLRTFFVVVAVVLLTYSSIRYSSIQIYSRWSFFCSINIEWVNKNHCRSTTIITYLNVTEFEFFFFCVFSFDINIMVNIFEECVW